MFFTLSLNSSSTSVPSSPRKVTFRAAGSTAVTVAIRLTTLASTTAGMTFGSGACAPADIIRNKAAIAGTRMDVILSISSPPLKVLVSNSSWSRGVKARVPARSSAPPPSISEPHISHTAHAAARHRRRLRLGLLADHRLGGYQEAGDGGRILQGGADDLGRIDDPGLDEIAVFTGLRVKADVRVVLLQEFADYNRAVEPSVLGDLARRGLKRPADDADADPLVVVFRIEFVERRDRLEQGDTAARNDALLDRGLGRVHRVVHAIPALLHLDLGNATDADHRDAAGQFGQTLLKLL